MSNNDAREIPSPPSGERVRVRGQHGQVPQYGKHRTRTTAARDFARSLRKNATDAEKRLWRLLRDRRFAEFKFRRQYACGIYYLDFHCAVAKLAIHTPPAAIRPIHVRTRRLRRFYTPRPGGVSASPSPISSPPSA